MPQLTFMQRYPEKEYIKVMAHVERIHSAAAKLFPQRFLPFWCQGNMATLCFWIRKNKTGKQWRSIEPSGLWETQDSCLIFLGSLENSSVFFFSLLYCHSALRWLKIRLNIQKETSIKLCKWSTNNVWVVWSITLEILFLPPDASYLFPVDVWTPAASLYLIVT